MTWVRRSRASVAAALLLAVGAPVGAHAQALMRDGGATYTVSVTSWTEIPFRTIVRQQYDFSCGSAALATLLRFHYDRPTTEEDVFKAMYAVGDQAKIQRVGFSLLDMKKYLQSIGLEANGYRVDFNGLRELDRPGIVLIQLGKYRHFVVIKGVRGDRVLLGDPALGLHEVRATEFMGMWNGVVFAISDKIGMGEFNLAAEWDAKPTAPLGAGYEVASIDALTREIAPLYQITPIIATGGPRP